MVAIISLLVILILSFLITRIATVALMLTGLSKDHAKFQARSAFTGVGFTTEESELVINHPVRRRIIMMLMILGNAGIISVVASLMLSFIDTPNTKQMMIRLSILVVGLIGIWIIATSEWMDRHLSAIISWALRRWTNLEVCDYFALLDLSGNYGISQFVVDANSWVAERTLAELKLSEEGILVLGIIRQDGKYIGAPTGSTKIHPKDTLILYGQKDKLQALHIRRRGSAGDVEHIKAVADHEKELRYQKLVDQGLEG